MLLFLTLFVSGQKQPIIKVYAYSQTTLKGAKPGGVVEEGGTEIKTLPAKNINYYFYIEYRPKEKFSITTLWISGKPFRAKVDSIQKTPVEIISEGESKKLMLVPATKNKVLLLIPTAEKNNPRKFSASLKTLVSKNELVIVYRWKSKIYYYTIPKIKILKPVSAI